MHRISHNAQEPVIDVASAEEIAPMIKDAKPGRYHIDEIRPDRFPSGHTSRPWGQLIHEFDGSVTDEPYPWVERRWIG
jgi:hypothetical protein